MSWTVIKNKSTTTVETDENTDYLFTKNAKITITKDGYTGISSSLKKNTLILNNDITVKDSAEGAAYGIDGYCSYASTDVPSSDYFLTIRSADNASKLTVEEKMASSDTYAYGIIFAHECDSNYYGTLNIGMAGESFKKTIFVTASNNEGDTEAYGIYSYHDMTVNAKLAAPIKATANAKNGYAHASAFYADNNLVFNAGIAADLTATANGKTLAQAYALRGIKSIAITGDIAGKISATATGNESYAYAYALDSGAITISGKITKAMSAKATSKSSKAYAYVMFANTNLELNNGIAADLTAVANGKNAAYTYALNGIKSIAITGDIAGKITANATSNDSTASACALYSQNGAITISGKITKAMSAKATSKFDSVYAYVMFANTDLTLNNGIAADLTAVANGKTLAEAYALRGKSSIMITGDIAGKISATASGSEDEAKAYALRSQNGAITISGRITKAMSAKATSKSSKAYAYVMFANTNLELNNGIDADLTAVANGKTLADVYALRGDTSITISGDIAGKISATATGNESYANAYALRSESGAITISGKITKAITAKATSKSSSAEAFGICANENLTLQNGINADITATANGKNNVYAFAVSGTTSITIIGDIASKITVNAMDTSTSTDENAVVEACALWSISGSITISGKITKAITIKATSKTSKTRAYAICKNSGDITLGGIAADITVMATSGRYRTAYAGGIYATGSLTINGDIAGRLTVKGSAGEGEVSGIHASSLTLHSSLGTLSVTCNGSSASGWDIGEKLTVKSGFLTGKATVTGTAAAKGLSVGKILDGDGNANVVATLDITVKASVNAIGINLIDDTDFTLKDSKITVKGGSAIFANDSTKSQNITLESSTLTGDVSLNSGNDTLELASKSKVTGDVNMGGDMDIVKIHSGSQVKGAITGAETLCLILDDASAKSTALWEGNIDQSAFFGAKLQLDLNNAVIGVGKYTLMKDTDGSNDWTGTSFEMKFDGISTDKTLVYGTAQSFAESPYEYELKTDKSGKSLILAVTEK